MTRRGRPGRNDAEAQPAPTNRGATALPNPPAEAVSLFESGVQAVQRHDYQRGARVLGELIERFPAERALLERARVYADLCRREMLEQAPKTIEERMTAATAALNRNDEAGAERLANSIVAEEPRHDLALYLLAVVACRRGETEGALDYLRKAVDISPEAAAQARLDDDFESLRDNDAFQQLTDAPANGASEPH